MSFDLSEPHLALLADLIARHLPGTPEVLVYGSRAKGNHTPRSDLDLVIKSAPTDRHRLAALREAIEDSDFPILCDLQYYEEIQNPALKNHIDRPFLESTPQA
jgi:predicted nucleotidyltransferase